MAEVIYFKLFMSDNAANFWAKHLFLHLLGIFHKRWNKYGKTSTLFTGFTQQYYYLQAERFC